MSSNSDSAKRAKQVRDIAAKASGLSDEELGQVVGGMSDNIPFWFERQMDEFIRNGAIGTPPGNKGGSN